MQQLFIHLHTQGASWAYRQQAEGLPSEIAQGNLSSIAAVDESVEVIVFVPATDVLLASTYLPKQSRSKLAKALPYALEEQCVDDIESLHVALGAQQADGRVYAAIVADTKMQSWLEALQNQGIHPRVIMPENLALPKVAGDWSALCLPDGICIVRSGEQTGFASERENMLVLAQRHLAECNNAEHLESAGQVNIINCSMDDIDAEQFPLPVSLEACNGDALASLINGYKHRAGINLCQGKYRSVSPLLTPGRHWIPAAVMLAIWLLLIFANSISQYMHLRAEDEAYKDKIVQLYKQTFPDAKRIVNARLQMQQKLNVLRGSEASEEGFLALMSEVASGLSTVEGLDIQHLSYKQGRLDLDIKLNDLQQLDKLKQLLLAIQSIDVNVQSATIKNNKLESRIRIGRVK